MAESSKRHGTTPKGNVVPTDTDLSSLLPPGTKFSFDTLATAGEALETHRRSSTSKWKGRGKKQKKPSESSDEAEVASPLTLETKPAGALGRRNRWGRGGYNKRSVTDPTRSDVQSLASIAQKLKRQESPAPIEEDFATNRDVEVLSQASAVLEDEVEDLKEVVTSQQAELADLRKDIKRLLKAHDSLAREIVELKHGGVKGELPSRGKAHGVVKERSPSRGRAPSAQHRPRTDIVPAPHSVAERKGNEQENSAVGSGQVIRRKKR